MDNQAIMNIVGASGLGVAGLLVLVKVVRMLISGKDMRSDCMVGKSVIHISVDGDGDGKVEAKEVVVLDMNKRSMKINPVELSKNGDDGCTDTSGSLRAAGGARTGVGKADCPERKECGSGAE